MLFFVVNGIALGLNLVPLAISQYVIGHSAGRYSALTVTIANFISANVIGTALGMAFRFWAYRKWVFPEELTPHPEIVAVEAAAQAAVEAPASERIPEQPLRSDPADVRPRRRSTARLIHSASSTGARARSAP